MNMTTAQKYKALRERLEHGEYTEEQLKKISLKIMDALIRKEEGDDTAFDLLHDIYQSEDGQ